MITLAGEAVVVQEEPGDDNEDGLGHHVSLIVQQALRNYFFKYGRELPEPACYRYAGRHYRLIANGLLTTLLVDDEPVDIVCYGGGK